jgi:hypothetical protein
MLGSSAIGALSARSAAGDAKDMQKRAYRKSKWWLGAGRRGLEEYENMLRAGPGEFDPAQDPGYLYGYKQYVENPTLRSAAARGRLFDASTQKALGRSAMDYASTKYDDFLNRYYAKMQPYWNLSEAGRGSALQSSQLAAGLQPLVQSAKYGQANALMAGIGGLANIANKAIDAYGTQNILNQSGQDYRANWQRQPWEYRNAVR